MKENSIHIIFDFDGTLWNSSVPVRNSLKFALKDKGYLKLANTLPEFEIGRPMEIILEKEFDFTTIEAKNVADHFREYLMEEDLKSGKFYANVEKIIFKLLNDGYKLSIATFKRKKIVEKILEKYCMSNVFHMVQGLGEDGLRSKTELVNDCITKEDNIILMVGDTIGDYQAAVDNDIDFYLVKYGYGYKNLASRVVSENIKVLGSFEEILNVINDNN